MRPEIQALLDKAHRRIAGAVRDLDAGDAEGAASRIYYAAFHAASAALASEGLSAKTHAGVHNLFYQHFVETGRLPQEAIGTLRGAYALREKSDYSAAAVFDQQAGEEMLEEVRHFIAQVEGIIT